MNPQDIIQGEPSVLDLEVRKTFKYNADNRALDEHDYLCEAKVWDINAETLGKHYHTEHMLQLAQEVDKDLAENAIKDLFIRGCSCVHDCCGHLFGGVDKITWHKNWAQVLCRYSQNH